MAGYSSYHSNSSYGDGEGDFERLAQSSSSNIQKISHNVRSMQQMVNQIGTPQDTESLRAELHKIQTYTNNLARDTNVYMKQLMEFRLTGGNSAEQRQKKMQRERLTQEFSTVLNNLQETQKATARKEKEAVAKTKAEVAGYKSRGGYQEERSGNQLIQLESPVQNQMTLQLEHESNLEHLREQEEAIHEIETNIVHVNQIFKDLALMVHEQGEMIDSIEHNIESASVQVEQGTQQLSKASNYQTAARKKLCIIVLILAVVLAVIITIIVFSVKK